MNQMLSQGLIFIPEGFIEYVDEDNNTITEEENNNNSHAIMPYSGFLSFPEEEETIMPKENLTANVTK